MIFGKKMEELSVRKSKLPKYEAISKYEHDIIRSENQRR
jgi:hypothetical protein